MVLWCEAENPGVSNPEPEFLSTAPMRSNKGPAIMPGGEKIASPVSGGRRLRRQPEGISPVWRVDFTLLPGVLENFIIIFIALCWEIKQIQ